jgi:hypothetical protein
MARSQVGVVVLTGQGLAPSQCCGTSVEHRGQARASGQPGPGKIASDHTGGTDGAYRHGATQTPGVRLRMHAVDLRPVTKSWVMLGSEEARGKREGKSASRADASKRASK